MQNHRRIAALAALLFFAGSALSLAADATIVDIRAAAAGNGVAVTARLAGRLPEKTAAAALSGLPLMFTYTARLERERSVVWNETVAEMKVHKLLKYDSLAKEFNAIERMADDFPDPEEFDAELKRLKEAPEGGAALAAFKSWDEAQAWLRTLKAGPLAAPGQLAPGFYHIEVKAEADKLRLIPPFNIIFFFLTITSFETDWAQSSPFAVEAPPAGAATR